MKKHFNKELAMTKKGKYRGSAHRDSNIKL